MEDESHSNLPNGTCSNKEQDRFLPIANVGRFMKKAIPGNVKISKDAKETVQECVSEFISFKYKEIEGEKINIPKQQRSEQRLHQQQHQHPHQDQNNNLPLSSVYSSPNLISQPPYVATDQLFFLPFSPNSIQKQLQPQDQIDSVGQW
ncbi:hypothetical protein AAZX31_04G192700 [Glycine max]|uniref:Transcription factor CBF/NF-Y/archaeal histone domain-containing protein n=1 Tax=Glycine max TaxID=3847 RepID=A0A0R0KIC7_SOYBN|nr:hypothetical protein GYH30_010638 [Glycine max]KRH64021.1 hypothetical protein GLYMA_04G211200v4 [Glycine max]